jgi:hypothetical protein
MTAVTVLSEQWFDLIVKINLGHFGSVLVGRLHFGGGLRGQWAAAQTSRNKANETDAKHNRFS